MYRTLKGLRLDSEFLSEFGIPQKSLNDALDWKSHVSRENFHRKMHWKVHLPCIWKVPSIWKGCMFVEMVSLSENPCHVPHGIILITYEVIIGNDKEQGIRMDTSAFCVEKSVLMGVFTARNQIYESHFNSKCYRSSTFL